MAAPERTRRRSPDGTPSPICAPAVGVVAACDALGVARASFYRSARQRAASRARHPSARPPPARALGATERATVLAVLHEERFQDRSPAAVQATLLDEGQLPLLDPHHVPRPGRRRASRASGAINCVHPRYQKPELLATAPNQLWSWDITKLLGPAKWTYFYLYVILDVFSRYVVGWMVAPRESAELAKRFIDETIAKQSIAPGQLTIHADRGAVDDARSRWPSCWPTSASPRPTAGRTSPTTTRIRKASSAR